MGSLLCLLSLICSIVVLPTEQILLGGSRPMNEEEFSTEPFIGLLSHVVRYFNGISRLPSWHDREAISAPTKQVVEGTLYTFNLHLRPTDCAKDAILQGVINQTVNICQFLTDEPKSICPVRLWHRPWLENGTNITISECWRVHPDSQPVAEDHRLLQDLTVQTPEFHESIKGVIDEYNVKPVGPHLYRYTKLGRRTEAVGKDPFIVVYLNETECARYDNTKTNQDLEQEECYQKFTGKVVRCIINLDSKQAKYLMETCYPIKNGQIILRRMAGSEQQSNNVFSDASKWKTEPLHVFLRSSYRLLTDEEKSSRRFRQLSQYAERAYNEQSNARNMFKLMDVENAWVEFEPNVKMTFRIVMQETTCQKEEKYTQSPQLFEEECHPGSEEASVQQCDVSVVDNEQFNEGVQVEVYKCQESTQRRQILVGGSRPMNVSELESERFSELLQRIVKKYNGLNNSVYFYSSDGAKNVEVQVVSGKKITMDLLMRAVGCRKLHRKQCGEQKSPEHLECRVTVLERPWDEIPEQIDIGECWRTVKNTDVISARWFKLPFSEISQYPTKEMIGRSVDEYNRLMGAYMILDYTTNMYRQSGKRNLTTYTLHLKEKDATKPKISCSIEVLTPGSSAESEVISVKRCEQKGPQPVNVFAGHARPLSEDETRGHDFQSILTRVMKQYNDNSSSEDYYRLYSFENPTLQLVIGLNVEFRLIVQQTNCKKQRDREAYVSENYHQCGPLNTTHVTSCVVNVYQRPWENYEQITFRNCTDEEIPPLAKYVIQPMVFDIREKGLFSRMVSRAVSVFNLQTDDEMLYERYIVTNITKVPATYGGCNYTFDLLLKPTKCRKWGDLHTFVNKRKDRCSGIDLDYAVSCSVNVWEAGGATLSEEISIHSCQTIYPPVINQPAGEQQLGLDETLEPKFQKMVNEAVELFDEYTQSDAVHKYFFVENAYSQPVAGRLTTFDLHMVPLAKRPGETNNHSQNASIVVLKYLISCHVEVYNAPWQLDTNVLEISDCNITHDNKSMVELGPETHLVSRRENRTPIDSVVLRFLDMFNKRANLRYQYEEQHMENVKEQAVAGKSVTFDLYLKPIENTSRCTKEEYVNGTCPTAQHLYYCKASVWFRPWLHSEVLRMDDCALIEKQKMIAPGEPWTADQGRLQQLTDDLSKKAVELYNQEAGDSFIYGKREVENVRQQFHAGMMTEFDLNMVPFACKMGADKEGCDPQSSKMQVHCKVRAWERPWLRQNERLQLEGCRKIYENQSVRGEHALTEEEKNSPEFQALLKNLLNLYKPAVPITYDVEEVVNGKVTQEEGRNTSFTMILKPSGCNTSLPNSEDIQCVRWAEQDKLECDALIEERPKVSDMKWMSLTNCRLLWSPEPSRPLSEEEKSKNWFQKSVRDALKLYQSLNKSPNLFQMRSIYNATLKREDVENVDYLMEVVETECVKGQDEEKLFQGGSENCPWKEPENVKKCDVGLIRNPDSSQKISIKCEG
ncbi:unnamed protein product [Calicophoron daubneyi]|uniref:Cystatin domain-containing protein n=1 Tax=Calicophoron daubneyi TaxID=300641 RepID=A0AAV2TNV2_CALDB